VTAGNGNGDDGRPTGPVYYAAPGPAYAGPHAPGPSGYAPEPEAEGMTLRDYLGVLWRRKWVILVVVVVATASAYYFANRQAKQYAAGGSLIYEQQVDLTSSVGGSYTDIMGLDRQMSAIPDIMASPDFRQRADTLLEAAHVDTSAALPSTPARGTPDRAPAATSSWSTPTAPTPGSRRRRPTPTPRRSST
jgi:hypothetical protein